MVLNLVVTLGFAGSFAWRLDASSGSTPWGPLVVSLVCLCLLTVSGTLGGRLAYRYGVRVAAESDQAAGFVRSDHPSARRARPTSSKGD
jgi:uncharacterized membrane protein